VTNAHFTLASSSKTYPTQRCHIHHTSPEVYPQAAQASPRSSSKLSNASSGLEGSGAGKIDPPDPHGSPHQTKQASAKGSFE